MTTAPSADEHTEPWILRHAAATIGWGAVVLYLLGVVTTLGRLHASEVDGSHGLAAIPLEFHLRNGIALVADWIAVLVILSYLFLYWAVKTMLGGPPGDAPTAEPVAGKGDHTLRRGRANPWLNRIGLGAAVVLGLITPWPTVLALVPAAAVVTLGRGAVLFARRHPTDAAWLREMRWDRLFLGTLFGLTLFLAALDALYRSSPLPEATLTTSSGAVVTGPLIANADGAFYVGDTAGLYRIVPSSEVRTATLVQRKRKAERSLLDIIGVT